MFALTIDTAWFTDPQNQIVIGGLALLWGSKYIPAGLLDKVKGWFKRSGDEPDWEDFPDGDDKEMPLLIRQMRLCVCDEIPSIRDGCNKHLDEIEQLINGTEIDGE